MPNESGALRIPRTIRRFERFVFDLAAKRSKRVTQDDAMDELLRRAGY